MQEGERKDVYKIYNKIAQWFFENRPQNLIEKSCLDNLIGYLPQNATVLDLGCGTGEPILRYLLTQGIGVVGVDASVEMLKIARLNFPETEFVLQDMRELNLNRKFDAIIAWHSFFHLPADDQPAMFSLFAAQLNKDGVLMFTSGTEHGEAWGVNGGENLFHASLDTSEYETLLAEHHFKILKYQENDPDCAANIWMAQYIG
ncbi:class I SAM-dependent methyltransferase [Mucilaginibacter corticis]|uniref:Class I SAM-dependent methyltransferase n=1 Tax=Mucilaginibacter corticis TaxID=2597670 RepID=A0A556MKB7_9SPHI|nr:class I SAM-dependent methyltransferase [Mucilaginibacter corticis]TSJ40336.1 class I SAM-dependent methyltransferase [Mucilaginibacter corticis]